MSHDQYSIFYLGDAVKTLIDNWKRNIAESFFKLQFVPMNA